MSGDRKSEGLPPPPRLPERAAIYIAPDGTVHFGALFEGLVPVADALRGGLTPPPCHPPVADDCRSFPDTPDAHREKK